jgi:hypothetical protein
MSSRGIIKYHERVIRAILELGKEKGYEANRGQIYYHLNGYWLEYRPDALWITKGKNPHTPSVTVWEVESGWADLKKIAGDIILTLMMRPHNHYLFRRIEEEGFGVPLKENISIPNFFGDGIKVVYKKGEHKKISFNVANMFIVTEHEGHESYWDRYTKIISEHLDFSGHCSVISISRGYDSVAKIKRRLVHLEELRHLF